MKTVIEMAREAGFSVWHISDPKPYDHVAGYGDSLERFAELVRADAIADEREACAKVCDVLAVHPEYASEVTKLAAMAIRARNKTRHRKQHGPSPTTRTPAW